MNAYEEKQQRKAERYQELASKAQEESRSQYERSNRISDAIPFGQPILVGHHSEGRHRRDIERIHNGMRNSIEAQEKAEYYQHKAENALDPKGISSDDPEAIPKLKEKLTKLEATREQYKAYNKKARQEKTEPLETWRLSNLSQNINTVKKRIEYLERQTQIQDSEETINGVTLKINKEENRVQLVFPGIPEESIRDKLKSNGFHWSPYNNCWQRQLSDWAVYIAKDILGVKQ
jgi:hypothetical protein